MTGQVMRGLILICLLYSVSASALFAEENPFPEKATVKDDSVPVYTGMSAGDRPVRSLNKGVSIFVEIEMEGAGDAWCGIRELDQETITGYVKCKYLERSERPKIKWQRLGPPTGEIGGIGGNITKVRIAENQVLVPVVLEYGGRTAEATLLLDTGASMTMINAEIADKLNIRQVETKIELGQVLGGGIIPIFVAKVGYITVGPNTKNNMMIGIVNHAGPPVKFEGLLGLDFLRGLKYQIDFTNEIIKWEP